MKSLLKYIIVTIVQMFVGVNVLYANNHPPTPRGAGGFPDIHPVGGAIDGYLILFTLIAVLFGVWKLKKIIILSKNEV